MSSPSIDDLKRDALEIFGKVLTDEQAESYKGRLPTMVQNVRLLADWGKRLEQAHPAQIQGAVEEPVNG
jgi:hypothetical protein